MGDNKLYDGDWPLTRAVWEAAGRSWVPFALGAAFWAALIWAAWALWR